MLNKEDIEKNYTLFIDTIKSKIKRDGVDKLLSYLENTDIKTAPASTKYHCAFDGGLVLHLLNVYSKLQDLLGLVYPSQLDNVDENGVEHYKSTCPYTEETIAIVALLHDISKVNFYENDYKNVKVYNENGSKYDDGGKFDWNTVKGYKIRENKDRFIYGSHAMNSIYMIRSFIKLNYEEELAVLYHMGGFDYSEDSLSVKNISEAFNKSPLALLLHQADMQATYLIENER